MNRSSIKLSAAVTGLALLLSGAAFADPLRDTSTEEEAIAEQAGMLPATMIDKGIGPQAPRDIAIKAGSNPVTFATAPAPDLMNLCNIHFHKGAEHRGGDFTTYRGNGEGHGDTAGFQYDGTLTDAELQPISYTVGNEAHGLLHPGDTIEVHYVHTTARVSPGATLSACFSDSIANPQLRVEAHIYVLVNDETAADFTRLNAVAEEDGIWRATGMPSDTGNSVQYAGSTTGPDYNQTGSPYQVTWSVHVKLTKVSISSVASWLSDNPFGETHAHGVRTLVTDERLLSPID